MIKYFAKYAPVAQGIERRFPKPCVGCSNHLGGAIYITAKFVGFRVIGQRVIGQKVLMKTAIAIEFSTAMAVLSCF